tara:strand:+ start:1683 stop:2339 length:657 start_codon:yes stop_codon:yes gene_type:complete
MGILSKAVNIGRRMSDRELTQVGSKNSRAVTRAALTNKNDSLPSLRADVMKDQGSDIDIMTAKGKKPTTSELTTATREAAEGRAMSRTAGRAGAVAGAGAAGFGVGSAINEAIGKDKEPASKESKKEKSSADERTNKEDFPVYKKGTESADTFQKAFKEAKKDGKDSFSFEGRKYNTKEDKKESKEMNKGGMVKGYAKGGMIKANCGASVPAAQKGKK